MSDSNENRVQNDIKENDGLSDSDREDRRILISSDSEPDSHFVDDDIPSPRRDVVDKHSASSDWYKASKSVQNFALASSICGAVSVIIGGVLLAGIGLALGITAVIKYRKLDKGVIDASLLKKIKISSIVAIIICLGAMVINMISAVLLFPTIMSYLETGDLSNYASMFDSNSASSSSRSSTWG